MGRRLAVADIHSEGHRLLQILDMAHYKPESDRLFLLGDYMDRGADAASTIHLVMDLVDRGAKAVLGNHDAVMLAYLQGDASRHAWMREWDRQVWMQQGGDKTMADFGGAIPDHVVNFLAGLPLYHEEPDCILVHAGLRPGVPLSEQTPDDLLWIRGEFHEGYRGKRVVFGHTPTHLLHGSYEVWRGPDKIGIDTGAVWGGRLSLLDLDTHQTWWA